MIRDGELVVAGGDRPVLLQAVDQPLDAVALAIGLPIEGALLGLVRPPWDHRADAPASQLATHRSAAVALVARHPLGSEAWSAASPPLDRPALQQGRQRCLLVALAPGQAERDRPAPALGPEVDLRGETSTTAPQGLVRPLLAPAACGWARTTLPSTKWIVQSRFPSASASACSSARILSQSPCCCQRRNRLYTVFQLPYRPGKSRQGAPVRNRHRIALRIRRWSAFGRPTRGLAGGSNGSRRFHCSSVSSCRRIPSWYSTDATFADTT
jgi:hypothetical protein